MSELISRSALLEEFNGIYDRHFKNSAYQFIHDFFKAARRRINKAPAVDAVEVVRCKDCKWYKPDTEFGIDKATGRYDHSKIVKKPYGECMGQNFHFTEDGFLRVGDNDFCSYGERK